jgi:hypothetical protein
MRLKIEIKQSVKIALQALKGRMGIIYGASGRQASV